MQIAERFHVLMNVREVVEKVMMRQHRLLRSRSLATPVSIAPTEENDAHAGCRERLRPHLERVKRVRRRRASARPPVPSARESAWMLLRPSELTDEQKKTAELWCRLLPEVGRAQQLALSFVEVVKERRADGLREWLVNAQQSQVAEYGQLRQRVNGRPSSRACGTGVRMEQRPSRRASASAEAGEASDVRSR
jgi:hypothetical protein